MKWFWNWAMPVVAARASVWPSTHAQHGSLLDELREATTNEAECGRELARAHDTLAQARLYGEKMKRDRDDTVKRCGADLLGILEDAGALLAPDLRALLERTQTPVVYWHDEDDGPPVVAIVDPSWLGDVWECAIRGGYVEPSVTDAGREAGFMPHEHTTPEDRAP